MAGVAEWFTVIMGTVLGVVFGLVGGPAKLCPCSPMNGKQVYGFDNVYGPFLGCPGVPLRLFTGIGELFAGVGLLVGLWVDVFGGFPEDLSNTVKALVIVAGSCLMTVSATAAFMHKYIDGSFAIPPIVFAVLSLIFTLLRIWCVEPGTWATQMVATWLSLIAIIGALITLIINKFHGKHESTVHEANEQMKSMT